MERDLGVSAYPIELAKRVRMIEENSRYGKRDHRCRWPSLPCERTWLRDCNGFWKGRYIIALFVASVVTLLGAVIVSVVEADEAKCVRVGNQAGLETKYSGGTYWTRDCYVRFNGEWVPYDRWINFTIPGDYRGE